MHTGGTTMVSFAITVSMVAFAAFTLFFTWVSVRNIDWKQPIEFNIANNFSTNY